MKYPSYIFILCLLLSNTLSTGFSAGTKIKTPTGYTPIEHIQLNDRVASFMHTQSTDAHVIHTHSSLKKNCRCIVLEDQQRILVSNDEYSIKIENIFDRNDEIELFEISL